MNVIRRAPAVMPHPATSRAMLGLVPTPYDGAYLASLQCMQHMAVSAWSEQDRWKNTPAT